MAGKKFLNPFAKVVVCCLGAAFTGYYLYQNIQAGELHVGMPLLRACVFVAFLYLLFRSIRDLVDQRGENGEN